jgi:hypothetical protein
MTHLTTAEIEEQMPFVTASPKDHGIVELIVRRPAENEREELETGELDIDKGLVGDVWLEDDGDRETQLTIMNSRIASILAQDDERRKLAGDQLFVDIELTDENLPCGTQISIGDAIVEVTKVPHNGCKKFVERFGLDAMRFVNSEVGKKYHLRGIYVKVVKAGTIKRGDVVSKVSVFQQKSHE